MSLGTALGVDLPRFFSDSQASVFLASSAMPPLLPGKPAVGILAQEASVRVCREIKIMLF